MILTSNFEILFCWVMISVVVGIFDHEHSVHRDDFKMLFGYILINLIVWYITVIDWILVKWLFTRRKK